MLPHPIYPLSGFVAKVITAEVSAQEQDERHARAVSRLQLMDLGRLLFATFVRVREIASRLGFDEDWEPVLAELLGLDHHVDRDIDLESLADGQVHAEGV